jgi:hypothetical protein
MNRILLGWHCFYPTKLSQLCRTSKTGEGQCHHMLAEAIVELHGLEGLPSMVEGKDEGLLGYVPAETEGPASVLVGEGYRLPTVAPLILLDLLPFLLQRAGRQLPFL